MPFFGRERPVVRRRDELALAESGGTSVEASASESVSVPALPVLVQLAPGLPRGLAPALECAWLRPPLDPKRLRGEGPCPTEGVA